MRKSAAQASALLGLLAHPKRLMLLCALIEKPRPVGELAELVELRESSTSQQLALLREAGLVVAIREKQMMRYHIDSVEAKEVIRVLHRLYCKE